MSKFLDELQELADAGFHENIVKQVHSLGENACRMLEIGILQDALVELGFKLCNKVINEMEFKNNPYENFILFYTDNIYIVTQNNLAERIYLSSPTWQQDLLDKVKELIND